MVVVHDAARPLVTPELVRRCVAALEGADGAIAAAPVTDTIKEADGRSRGAHPGPRGAVGDPDAAGVPRRRAARALDASPDVLAGATDDASLVEAAGGTVRVVEAAGREPQGHHRAGPADGRGHTGGAMLTDLHVHLRPDDDGTAAARLLHRRERRALPRSGLRARHRRAGGVRARAPLHRSARGVGPPLVAPEGHTTTSTPTARSCARRPTCGWASRPTSCAGREDRMAVAAGRARVGLRGGLGPLPARRGGGHARQRLGRVALEPTRRRSGRATSRRSARRPAPACSTSSPTPTW